MDETKGVQNTIPPVGGVADASAAETTTDQGNSAAQQPAGESKEISKFQQMLESIFGGKQESSAANNGTAGDSKQAKSGAQVSDVDIDARIQAERAKWDAEQKEKQRLAGLPPEEKAAAEQKAKDEKISQLEAKVLTQELKGVAVAELSKDGLPADLADLLDYTSKESMEKSLKTLKTSMIAGYEAMIKKLVPGGTPDGLGGAGKAGKDAIAAQIEKNICKR